MWKSQTLFLTFPSIVRKVWENPDAFPGFFHAFPQYVISIKQENPQAFSVKYQRAQPKLPGQEIEDNILKELAIEKVIIESADVPLKSYNYSYIKDLLQTRIYQLKKGICEIRFWVKNQLVDIQKIKKSDLRGVRF